MAINVCVLKTFLVGFCLCLLTFTHSLPNDLRNNYDVVYNTDGEKAGKPEPEESQIDNEMSNKYYKPNMAVYVNGGDFKTKSSESTVTFDDENLGYKQTDDEWFISQNIGIVSDKLAQKTKDEMYIKSKVGKTQEKIHQKINENISTKLARKPRDVSNDTVKNGKTREEKYPCYKYGSCSYNNGTYPPNCYCDDVCVIYNDCCLDAGTNVNFTSTLPFEKTQYLYNFSSCVTIDNAIEEIDGDLRGFYMVTSCPSFNSTDRNIESKCTYNNFTKFPVPVTDGDGITYVNVFCAICHGVTNFTYWDIGVNLDHCESIDFISFADSSIGIKQKLRILHNDCLKMYIPPAQFIKEISSYPRVCLKYFKKFYDKTPSKRCKKYINPVLTKYLYLVRNYNCLKNKYKNSTFSCIDPKTRPPIDFYRYYQIQDGISTTAILKFQTYEENKQQYQISLYDEYDECEGSFTLTMKMDDTKVCVTEKVRNYHFQTEVVLMCLETPSVDFFKRALTAFYKTLPIEKYQMKLYSPTTNLNKVNVICGENKPDLSNTCCKCTLNLSFIVEAEIDLVRALELRDKLRNKPFSYSPLSGGVSGRNRINRFIESRTRDDTSDNRAVCQIPVSGVKILKQFVFNNDLINSLEASVDSEINDVLGQGIDMFLANPIQQDVTTSPPQLSLQHKGNSQDDFISVYSFVKYLVMGISSLSLITTLVLYIYLGHYRSLVGHICLNIMSVWILSNFVYIFGIEATANKIVCITIGAILHYTLLCSFTWVFVCTLLVSQIMSKFKSNLLFNPEIYFSKQSIYFFGYCFPLIIIIPCVAMEIIQVSNLEIGYSDELCFLSVYPANITFLSVPIILSVGVSFIIFVILSQFKRKYDLKEIHVSARICLDYVNAFAGYCLVSFLLWIFGILVQFFKNEIPGYFFTIVIGSHGLLFSVCILRSKQVQNTLCLIARRPSKFDTCPESTNICHENEYPKNLSECFQNITDTGNACREKSAEFVKEYTEIDSISANQYADTVPESPNGIQNTRSDFPDGYSSKRSESADASLQSDYDQFCTNRKPHATDEILCEESQSVDEKVMQVVERY